MSNSQKHPTVGPLEPPTPKPAPREGLALTVDRDGWTKGFQVSLALTEDGRPRHGYRIAGPKYNGSSTTLLSETLNQRDADEIRRMLDRVFPPVLTLITARPVDLNPAAWGEDDEEPKT